MFHIKRCVMAFYTDDKINSYSKYISDTEDKLCYRTLEKIKNIFLNNGFSVGSSNYADDGHGLKYSFPLKRHDGNEFTFLVQGSFANGTCIRQDSDLDIAIISESTFKCKYRNGASGKNYGFVDSQFNILTFKNEVLNILRSNGFNAKKGSKCINVDFSETNKKSFDIVPCLRYRDYSNEYFNNVDNFRKGAAIITEQGEERINYPEQSIENSISKNNLTNYYYKKVVRILKNVKKDMEEENNSYAKAVSSYELECLIYNVPNDYFLKIPCIDQSSQLKAITKQVINYLYIHSDYINGYSETNDILAIYSDKSKNANTTKQFLSELYLNFN